MPTANVRNVACVALSRSSKWLIASLATVDSCASKEGASMKIEITIGPITVLKLQMFEVTEDLAERDSEMILIRDDKEGGDDFDRKLRGED